MNRAMYPVLFRLGPIEMESFWVMLFLGFFAATAVVRSEYRRYGIEPRLAYDTMLYAYVGGLVGARLFLLLTAWDVFLEDPAGFLLSGSGWVWYGGLIGGTVAVWWGTAYLRIPTGIVADAAGSALAMGQAIGRIGCQLAGDGDYGVPSDLPWAMSYPDGVVPTTERVHPTPIYETLLLGAVFAWLWRGRAQRARSENFFLYLILSGVCRLLVEFVRLNTAFYLGLTLAQWISLGCIAVGAIGWARVRNRAVAPAPA